MKAKKAIALLHDHTEGRHDLIGQESQEIEWLIVELDKENKELREERSHNAKRALEIAKERDEAEQEIKELKELLKEVNDNCYLGDNDLTYSIKQALKK